MFYFLNRLNLYTSHPNIYEEFLNSNFTVQQSLANTFRKLEPDEAIKTTKNKDTKRPGDTTGISNKGLSYLNTNNF